MEKEEHPLAVRLQESAVRAPEECLALMTDEEVGSLADAPDVSL